MISNNLANEKENIDVNQPENQVKSSIYNIYLINILNLYLSSIQLQKSILILKIMKKLITQVQLLITILIKNLDSSDCILF